ncbi:hypothetical protein PGTUg99_016457 [Puccinia graminis f. sp. tritici]|uniref:hAT-like transposase RNase-H fold domain-containing protein n=1 Tax=Puccinia graminis f. sp. tritici TaxID=56615 RepID=A0A5B0QGY0_PUCGR|nr:hypothetical protein PGTUg99_016457 [Puccinia graminis f. sp. tritici]
MLRLIEQHVDDPFSLEWQRDKKYGLNRNSQVGASDIELANDLAIVLQPFYEITLQISTAGSPQLSHSVVFIDQVTEHLSTIISEKKYPAALRNACRAGLQITNKYYTLTDCSPLYRIAMILHPSFKDEYFKIAGWSAEWIKVAIDLTREMWVTHYKPQVKETASANTVAKPKVSSLNLVPLQ